jgi:hypothetical protein
MQRGKRPCRVRSLRSHQGDGTLDLDSRGRSFPPSRETSALLGSDRSRGTCQGLRYCKTWSSSPIGARSAPVDVFQRAAAQAPLAPCSLAFAMATCAFTGSVAGSYFPASSSSALVSIKTGFHRAGRRVSGCDRIRNHIATVPHVRNAGIKARCRWQPSTLHWRRTRGATT